MGLWGKLFHISSRVILILDSARIYPDFIPNVHEIGMLGYQIKYKFRTKKNKADTVLSYQIIRIDLAYWSAYTGLTWVQYTSRIERNTFIGLFDSKNYAFNGLKKYI